MGIEEYRQILNNLVNTLNIQRSNAYSSGDVNGVIEIDKKIMDTENTLRIINLGLSTLTKE